MANTIAILSARGAFYRVAVYDDFSPAYYQIDELARSLTEDQTSLKDSLNRQTQMQQNALDNTRGQTSVLKRVNTSLNDPARLTENQLELQQTRFDLGTLADKGLIDSDTQDILSNPVSQNEPASAQSVRFTTTRDLTLPPAIADSEAQETNLSQQLQTTTSSITSLVTQPQGLDRSQILILGVQFGKRDIVSQVPCLNNAKVLYTFGQNFGDVAIRGEVLLGGVGDHQTAELGVRTLTQWFEAHRVSRSLMPVALSVASHAFYVYLTGLVIQDIDTEYHTMPFVMMGTLLDLQRDEMDKINPPGSVVSLSESELDLPITSLEQALAKRKTLKPVPDVTSTGTAAAGAANNPNQILPPTSTQTNQLLSTTPESRLMADRLVNATATPQLPENASAIALRNDLQSNVNRVDVAQQDIAVPTTSLPNRFRVQPVP